MAVATAMCYNVVNRNRREDDGFMLVLAEPDVGLERAYRDMMAEWSAAGETPLPWVLQEDASDFAALVKRLRGVARGEGIPPGYAPSSTWYAVDDGTGMMAGAVNIRHWLADEMGFWGHVGVGVRPGLRGRGYGTALLALALEKCAALGIRRAMAACYKDNVASARAIMKSGGALDRELPDPHTGRTIQQYWLDTGAAAN
jgi:predicted acetyltransferase